MLNVLIIIGWLLAICCMLYLAKELVKDRFHARRARKLAIRNAIRARRREQFMENRRRWTEINTGVIQARPAEAAATSAGRRRGVEGKSSRPSSRRAPPRRQQRPSAGKNRIKGCLAGW